MAENPAITQIQLMEETDLTRKQIQKDMKQLREKGLLVRMGNNRNGQWVVKEKE